MTKNKKHLFLFTIGPVQSFIAQARKTEDLYAGSQLLSALVRAGITKLPNEYTEVIFPILNKEDENQSLPNRFVAIVEKYENELKELGIDVEKKVRAEFKKIAGESLGNRTKPNGFDDQIKRHLDIHWAFHPLDENNYSTSYKEIEALLGSIKNVRPFEQFGNGDGEAGRKCSLDGENNALFFGKETSNRFFKSKWNPFAIELKSTSSVKVQANEGLGAVSFTKRFFDVQGTNKGFDSTTEIALLKSLKQLKNNDALGRFKDVFDKSKLIEVCKEEGSIKMNGKDWESFNEQFYYEENLIEKYIPCEAQLKIAKKRHQVLQKVFKENEVKFDKYYALIMFDGDKMGERLSKADKHKEHKDFSISLAKFAKVAREIVNEYGQTVYAGGDDFLGFVNLHYLFKVMIDLREAFDKEINSNVNGDKKLTFSAGIVIAHYKMPLAEVLKTVRKVEKKAKNDGDRNAFCITAMKHSGEIQETVMKWGDDNANWKALEHITKQLSDGVFSNKFITNLTVELYQLAGLELDRIGRISNDAISSEFKRLVKRALIERSDSLTNENNINTLVEKLEILYKNSRKSNERVKNFIHALQITDFLSRKIN